MKAQVDRNEKTNQILKNSGYMTEDKGVNKAG